MIDLSSLRDDKPRFIMQTATLGEVRCYSIEFRSFEDKLRAGLKAYKKMTPAQLVRSLFAELATNAADLPFKFEDAERLTDSELEEFAGHVVAKHATIFRSPHRTPDPKQERDSTVDYLVRSLLKRVDKHDPIRGWAGANTFDALERARQLSDTIGRGPLAALQDAQRHAEMVESAEAFRPLPMPRNPLLKTNEHLEDLKQEFEASRAQTANLFELVRSVNSAATGLLTTFAEGAIRNDAFSKRSLIIAMIALAAAVLMPTIQITYDILKKPDVETRMAIERLSTDLSKTQSQAAKDLRNTVAEALDRSATLQRADVARVEGADAARVEELNGHLREIARLLRDANAIPAAN
jgi:hypothetical protein